MIYKISLKLIITIVAIVLMSIFGLYYLFNSGVFADDTFVAGKPETQLDHSEDVDGDGDAEKISLLTYKVDEEKIFILEIRDSIFSKRRLVLENFEIDLRFCNSPMIDANEKGRYICVVGFVGMHSERVEVIKFSNNSFKKIYFQRDNLLSDNMISDAPNVIVDNKDEGSVKICVDNRNYDKNPLLDFFRTCYILNDKNELLFESISSETMREDTEAEGAIQ